MATQICCTPDCPNLAAFRTRTKPTWCMGCINDQLTAAGLEAAEPFPGPRDWWLTTCLTCGVQAHYRLEYIQDKNAVGERACRACFWKAWAEADRNKPWNSVRRMMVDLLNKAPVEYLLAQDPPEDCREFLESGWWPRDRIAALAQDNGYDLIATTTPVNDGHDPVIVRCRRCGRISAERVGDIAWSCSCSRLNTKSSYPTLTQQGRVLLADSDSEALIWWDHDANDEAQWRTVTVRATRRCHWQCPHCGLKFQQQVYKMTGRPECPDCEKRRHAEWSAKYEEQKRTPIADVPELAGAWADEADPRTTMVGDHGLRRFRCPNGHYPRISATRYLSGGCPHCRGAETAKNKQSLADTLPEIAAQWHPDKNGKYTPEAVVWDSQRYVWWRADCCGYEWQDSVRDRDKYQRLRCPKCRTILGSLAWQDPGLAAEWSQTNPISAWQVRPHASTHFVPEWICANDPRHVWRAPLAGRSNGAECPECRQSGKSKVELDHHAAAVVVFGNARSGVALRNAAFTTRKSWTADIAVDINSRLLIIEYDGAYWHSAPAKMTVDERKTMDLLAAGYMVARLRENELTALNISHPDYMELHVHSTAPRPHEIMTEILSWATQRTAKTCR